MKVFGSNYLIKTKLLGISLGFGMSQKKSQGHLGCREQRKWGNLSGGISAQGPSHWVQVDETVSDRGSDRVGAPPGRPGTPLRTDSEQSHPATPWK